MKVIVRDGDRREGNCYDREKTIIGRVIVVIRDKEYRSGDICDYA